MTGSFSARSVLSQVSEVEQEIASLVPTLPAAVQELLLPQVLTLRLAVLALRHRVERTEYERARRDESAAGTVTAQGRAHD